MSPNWPALMTRETAAAYCDMSPAQFDAQCPVAPVDQGWRGLRWKRVRLDAWIENLPEKPRPRALSHGVPANDAPPPPISADERRRASLDRL